MMSQWGIFIACVSASIFMLGVGFVLSLRIIQIMRDHIAHNREREWENRYRSLHRGYWMMRNEIRELSESFDNEKASEWADRVLVRLTDIEGDEEE